MCQNQENTRIARSETERRHRRAGARGSRRSIRLLWTRCAQLNDVFSEQRVNTMRIALREHKRGAART